MFSLNVKNLGRLVAGLGMVVLLCGSSGTLYAQAGDQFIGQLLLVPYTFAPQGWALCNGQLLPIAQNTALFSLLGTTYGGNGINTFALPDLRGRVAIGAGQGPGLSDYLPGQSGGEESHTLTISEMPAHSHVVLADSTVGTSDRPANGLVARNAAGIPQYGLSATTTMNGAAVGTAGGGQPHNIMQPYLTMTWIIALQGVYPSRPEAQNKPAQSQDQKAGESH